MAAVRHLELKKIFFGYLTVIGFTICCCGTPHFIKNRTIFAARCYASAASAVMWCLSVCHGRTFC